MDNLARFARLYFHAVIAFQFHAILSRPWDPPTTNGLRTALKVNPGRAQGTTAGVHE
jgi:hypothetical protein